MFHCKRYYLWHTSKRRRRCWRRNWQSKEWNEKRAKPIQITNWCGNNIASSGKTNIKIGLFRSVMGFKSKRRRRGRRRGVHTNTEREPYTQILNTCQHAWGACVYKSCECTMHLIYYKPTSDSMEYSFALLIMWKLKSYRIFMNFLHHKNAFE